MENEIPIVIDWDRVPQGTTLPVMFLKPVTNDYAVTIHGLLAPFGVTVDETRWDSTGQVVGLTVRKTSGPQE